MKDDAPYPVLLPKWVFDARDKEEFKRNLAAYMKHYPHYIVRGIEDRFALCERRD